LLPAAQQSSSPAGVRSGGLLFIYGLMLHGSGLIFGFVLGLRLVLIFI
jgi:hypothetical protein